MHDRGERNMHMHMPNTMQKCTLKRRLSGGLGDVVKAALASRILSRLHATLSYSYLEDAGGC